MKQHAVQKQYIRHGNYNYVNNNTRKTLVNGKIWNFNNNDFCDHSD